MKRIIAFSVIVMALTAACSTASAPTITVDVPTVVPTAESEVEEPAGPVTQKLKVFVVAYEGEGDGAGKEIGCGDHLVAIDRLITTPTDSLDDTITGALTELFSMTPEEIQETGYHSVFPAMQLTVTGTLVENRVAHVDLAGTPTFGGVCDTPRFFEQIDATIRQFSGIQDVRIRLNGSADAYQALGSQQ